MTMKHDQLQAPMKQVSIRLPGDLVEHFAQSAKAEDRTLSQEVRRAMRSYLNRDSGPEPRKD